MFCSFTVGLVGLCLCLLSALCCQPKEYTAPDGQCCPMCHEGTVVTRDCTEEFGTGCGPCANGTFMNHPNGMRQCLRCTICHSGVGLVELRSCSSTSDSVCGPRAGFFCLIPRDESGGCERAQSHSSCIPGQRVLQPGSSSADTVCEDCPERHFSPTGHNCSAWTICPHNQEELRSGSRVEDVLCGAPSRSHFVLTFPFLGFVVLIVLCMLRGKADPQRQNQNAPI